MTVDRSFVARNSESRAALTRLVERLEPADLALITEDGGWTVGQVLGHLAFWDRFLESRWAAARAAGESSPAILPDFLADILNVGLAPILEAFASAAPDAIRGQTLGAAEAIDRLIEDLPQETPVEAILAERPAALDRSDHRGKHVAQIERALATKG